MNMLASTVKMDKSLLDLPSKARAPAKPAAKEKLSFAQLVNSTKQAREKSFSKEQNNNKVNQSKGTADNQKVENQKLHKLIDFLKENRQDLPIPAEVSPEEVEAIINLLMGELDLLEVDELDADIIAYLNEKLALIGLSDNHSDSSLVKNNNSNIPASQQAEEEEIVLANPRANSANRLVGNNNEAEPRLTVVTKEAKTESSNKMVIPNLTSENNPKNNSNSTDVKKLIDLEMGKFNHQKVTANNTTNNTRDNQLTTEQPSINSPDNETANQNLNRFELSNIRNDNRMVLINDKPVEVKEVIDQIVRKAELVLRQNASEIRINLKPEFLGKMTIKIAVEQGIVTARFLTENMQVKHLLESNLNTLRQALESQGIKVERTEVNVQLNNGGMFDGSETNQDWELAQENSSNYQHNLDIADLEDNIENYELDDLEENLAGLDYYQLPEETTLSFVI